MSSEDLELIKKIIEDISTLLKYFLYQLQELKSYIKNIDYFALIQKVGNALLYYLAIYLFFKPFGIDLNKAFNNLFKLLKLPFELSIELVKLKLKIIKLFAEMIKSILNFIFKSIEFILRALHSIALKLLTLLAQLFPSAEDWQRLSTGRKEKISKFMGYFERLKYLNSLNRGILVNGKDKRVSQEQSFKHFTIIATTGGGKTSKFIIPNVLSLDNCSMVITDLSGEIYKKTSNYLKSQGFNIKVFAPEELNKSHTYNPLLRLRDLNEQEKSKEISELSQILINSVSQSNSTSSTSDFFNQSAQRILNILIYCLVKQPYKAYCNFHNLNYLLNKFSANSEELDTFINIHTADNQAIFTEYTSIKYNNSSDNSTLQSILLTAQTAVNKFTNQNLAKITTSNTIDFESFREEKTAFFIIIPQQKLSYYSFLLNILYTQMFNSAMEKAEDEIKDKLPIYFLLDEFGHLKIPDFPTIITTIRKYKVSLNLVLQSTKQLEIYGHSQAETILNGGVANQIYLSIDLETAQKLEKILGESQITQTLDSGHISQTRERLMTSSELMRLSDKDRAIYLITGKTPILLKMKAPYFKQFKFRKKVKLGAYPLETNTNNLILEYLDL